MGIIRSCFSKASFGTPDLELWMKHKKWEYSGLGVSEQLFKL